RVPNIWAALFPGGGEDWRYWHLEVDGYPSDAYSFATDLARNGIGAVAFDNPGSGESRWPLKGDELTLELVGQGIGLAARQLRQRLQAGTLVAALDPVPNPFLAGIGHSAGGALAVVAESQSAPFDALGVMGWATNRPAMIPEVDQKKL